MVRSVDDFFGEFVGITGLRPSLDDEYRAELDRLVGYLSTRSVIALAVRRRRFLARVNSKFRLNAGALAALYATAARAGFTFHYHHKQQLQAAFDLRDITLLRAVLDERGVDAQVKGQLVREFSPVEERYTLEHLANECRAPSKLRRPGTRNVENEIIQAQFSAFMWVSVPAKDMHRFFDPEFSDSDYRDSFWEQLHRRSPHLFSRDNALHVVRLGPRALTELPSASAVRAATSQLLECLYSKLNNYGFLAVVLEPFVVEGRSMEWEVAADLTLFGEKHREFACDKSYFRWERVRDETRAYIPSLDVDAAHFELVNEGYTYRDCFALMEDGQVVQRLVLLFQKNERDETPVPCPTCRSARVRGNSYPSLGVRSWECCNPLCPDRSKYNRGKRYAFRGLAMQRALEDSRNQIPADSIRRWTRDVVTNVMDSELTDMLVRHYSMYGDTIHVHGWPEFDTSGLGRETKHHALLLQTVEHSFWNGPFSRRYCCRIEQGPSVATNLGDEHFQVLHGDSASVLSNLPADQFDGAITSPPYYNARQYSQWPNMYCYLHDMHRVNTEVFRTLKAGALYLYNVFDYFDNERTIAFSAMGQRRMLLSSYTVDLFRRIGFELIGNVVWDKGDIEGKRGFNAGNFSPYYQAPFNCWEHVLVFRKPAHDAPHRPPNVVSPAGLTGRVLRKQPVIKMVRGKNVHGHTAPFPEALPELLMSRLRPGALVLDPFAGSLTTGRVAERHGVRSVCIERSETYCRLGLEMREAAKRAPQR